MEDATKGLRNLGTSPAELWLGLYLITFSAQFLSNLLYVRSLSSWPGRALAVTLTLVGVGLFAAGGYLLTRGIGARETRLAAGATAVLFGLAGAMPLVIYGAPFSSAVGAAGRTVMALDLLGSLALLAAGVWLLLAALEVPAAGWLLRGRFRAGFPRGLDLFGLTAVVLVGTVAVEKGLVPFLKLLVNIVVDPGALAALAGYSVLSLLGFLLPPLVRGAAAAAGLWALSRLERETGAVALYLWAAAELLGLAALWIGWTGALATPPPVALRIQTTLLIALPVIPLAGLAGVLRRRHVTVT